MFDCTKMKATKAASSSGPNTVGEMRSELQEGGTFGVDPEELWRLEDVVPYDVELDWSGSGPDGAYDAWLWRRGTSG